MVAALPFAGETTKDAVERWLLRRRVGDGEGFAAGLLQEFAVAQGVGDVKAEGAGLASAEEFAGTAELQIGFGNFKTVGGAHHGFEAGAGFVGHAHGTDQDAVRFLRAPADASAKLVELGEAE